MDAHNEEDGVPDPFEVGDDELEDESESSRDGHPENTGVIQEIGIGSGQESLVNLLKEIPKKNISPPPLPPKELVPSTPALPLASNLQALLVPGLFLPVPEVCPSSQLVALLTVNLLRPIL